MWRVEVSSKKRIFELAAEQIAEVEPDLSDDDIYTQLLAREKLGTTGLGQGVAIPHCRVEGCAQPLGCLITLDQAIPFDAPDNVPVDLLFVLLVPLEATQEHLDILAELAGRFSDPAYCSALRNAHSSADLLDSAVHSEAA
ncbi:phosphotransferase system, nitrogen regulatory IIA protein [Luminiphilus syltensis NOR5-1B]|uniref:Phosphotransferase system, nitrogen regulatory IIA protein n=2 Tax=Luminiphilus TaxID=1341118 RepID=B8KR88_9GAMM|nr:phosphotransferase system, nitrogen regulatory IIA protein [Luminiphilus syltensis NOR5-1B]